MYIFTLCCIILCLNAMHVHRRHDRTDPNATYKPLQVGTKMFCEELAQRFFSPSDDIVTVVTGRQLSLPYLNQTGFTSPILVTDKVEAADL